MIAGGSAINYDEPGSARQVVKGVVLKLLEVRLKLQQEVSETSCMARPGAGACPNRPDTLSNTCMTRFDVYGGRLVDV